MIGCIRVTEINGIQILDEDTQLGIPYSPQFPTGAIPISPTQALLFFYQEEEDCDAYAYHKLAKTLPLLGSIVFHPSLDNGDIGDFRTNYAHAKRQKCKVGVKCVNHSAVNMSLFLEKQDAKSPNGYWVPSVQTLDRIYAYAYMMDKLGLKNAKELVNNPLADMIQPSKELKAMYSDTIPELMTKLAEIDCANVTLLMKDAYYRPCVYLIDFDKKAKHPVVNELKGDLTLTSNCNNSIATSNFYQLVTRNGWLSIDYAHFVNLLKNTSLTQETLKTAFL